MIMIYVRVPGRRGIREDAGPRGIHICEDPGPKGTHIVRKDFFGSGAAIQVRIPGPGGISIGEGKCMDQKAR